VGKFGYTRRGPKTTAFNSPSPTRAPAFREYQTRIFDRFFRVPGQTKTGAGLGLSIAREITVAHGGRIGVKSAPGEGSAFHVVLKGDGAA